MQKLDSNNFVADISVGSNFYALLPRLPNTHYGALAEFIDNSVSSFIQNRNLPDNDEAKYDLPFVDVKIKFDKSAERIEIHDNASGISIKDLPRALKPLEAPNKFEDTLNEHGYGMKGAAGWYAKKFTIYTSTYGEPVARKITYEFDKIVDEKLTQIPVLEEKEEKDRHYTIITLEKFNDKRFPHTNSMKAIQSHLSDIYRTFIRDGVLRLTFNDKVILPMEVKIKNTYHYSALDTTTGKLNFNARKILWKKFFEFKNLGKNNKGVERYITGFGALKESGSHSIHSGMAIFNNGRILKGSGKDTNKPRELYGSGNTYRSLRLTGEIHLHNFDTTASKDDLIWGDLREEELYKNIHESLSGNRDKFLEIYNQGKFKESELNAYMPLIDQIEHVREKVIFTTPKTPNIPTRPVINSVDINKNINSDLEKDIGGVLRDAQDELKSIKITGNSPSTKSNEKSAFDVEEFNNKILSEKPWNISVSSQEYLIEFSNELLNSDDLYTVMTNEESDPIQVVIHINSAHEFVQNFLGPIQKEPVSIFLRMIVSLAISEITLPQIYGSSDVPIAMFRDYFNNYLTNHLSMLEIE
jgi:hypothetical protein